MNTLYRISGLSRSVCCWCCRSGDASLGLAGSKARANLGQQSPALSRQPFAFRGIYNPTIVEG